jgi:protein quaking
MTTSASGGGGGVARFMAYSPSPSAPHSPHLSGLRSAASSALLDQEKYLSELLGERHNIGPFMLVLPNTYRLLNQEILRVTTLLGNASVLGQSGGSPMAAASGRFFFKRRSRFDRMADITVSIRNVKFATAFSGTELAEFTK